MKIVIDTNDYKEKPKRAYKKSGKYSKKKNNIGFDFGKIGKRMRGIKK